MLKLRVFISNNASGRFEWFAWLDDERPPGDGRERRSTRIIGKLTTNRDYVSARAAYEAAQRAADRMSAQVEYAHYDEKVWDGRNWQFAGDHYEFA